MMMTKSLDYKDITSKLDKENDVITIIGCNDCIRVGGAGGPVKFKELAMKLKADGYNVKEGFLLPIACMEPYLFTIKLSHEVNTAIVLSCSAGWSNVKRNYPHLKVIQTVEDLGLMTGDADRGTLKLNMPYKKYNDLKNCEFVMGSDGQKIEK